METSVGQLNRFMQQRVAGANPPFYGFKEIPGRPAHDRRFTATCTIFVGTLSSQTVQGKECVSKKAAKESAAVAMLMQMDTEDFDEKIPRPERITKFMAVVKNRTGKSQNGSMTKFLEAMESSGYDVLFKAEVHTAEGENAMLQFLTVIKHRKYSRSNLLFEKTVQEAGFDVIFMCPGFQAAPIMADMCVPETKRE